MHDNIAARDHNPIADDMTECLEKKGLNEFASADSPDTSPKCQRGSRFCFSRTFPGGHAQLGHLTRESHSLISVGRMSLKAGTSGLFKMTVLYCYRKPILLPDLQLQRDGII